MAESSRKDTAARARHLYFQQIEEAFIGLRGAPMLLSPVDWQVARGWYEAGIPAALVVSVLEELFARRAERGQSRRVSSLRYCSRAVEDAWRQTLELTGGVKRQKSQEPSDWRESIARLAEQLPAALPDLERWRSKILALRSESSAERVEERLSELDGRLIDTVLIGMSGAERARLEKDVASTVGGLADRVEESVLEETRRRRLRLVARERAGLPLLSLFTPEAEG